MKATLAPGLAITKDVVVDVPRVIGFMGDDCRVYATPQIVNDFEYTCRNFVLTHLDPGEDTVGTRVQLDHLGPALLGTTARFEVAIAKVEGRRITFEGKVIDHGEVIAQGSHERFVVDTAKTKERLLKRRAAQGL
jgi:fluoroacetyl-CoA thioesterase